MDASTLEAKKKVLGDIKSYAREGMAKGLKSKFAPAQAAEEAPPEGLETAEEPSAPDEAEMPLEAADAPQDDMAAQIEAMDPAALKALLLKVLSK